MDRPEGTVTFLFTDIEGSTKLWERYPQQMQIALARHDALMREAIHSARGYVFKTVGDAFCAAFATAADAVQAALDAQRALAAEPWPEKTHIRVRMAVHTGAVQSRDEDYFGPTLNRVGRLMATGHGGQILLSLAASELTRDSLPDGATLRPLGAHRLKDLGRPETIFQLVHHDLPADFAALRSLDNPDLRHNLSQQMTSFIGREAQLAQVAALLERTRLLTLIGSGGCGKTRLALQVAADLLEGESDGVWLVELAPLSELGLVAQTIADAFGVKEASGSPILTTLCEHLKSKHLLLVLDNCEHLRDACAQIADTLLRQCPRVRILATSREGLGIAGETTYRVPPLSLPDRRQAATAESLSHVESVRLFIERALQVQTDFTVTNSNAPALASLCLHLDGIPLAIELAAARVRSLSVEEIEARLDQRFRLLTGGNRMALARQKTLKALIDWSYDLLSDGEKALLCRLSVFAGSWTLESAEAVCCGEPIESWEVLDLLTSLCDKSLVVSEASGSHTRYRLLETVRQYAWERLRESHEEAIWQDRHLAHFLALGEGAEPHLMGPEQQLWLERLETEHDNLRGALEWSMHSPEGSGLGLRLAVALWQFWDMRGHLSEGLDHLRRTLAAAPGEDPAVRAKALNRAGVLTVKFRRGDYATALVLLEESLTLRRELGDRRGIAASLGNLGLVSLNQSDYATAQVRFEESLAIFREMGDQLGSAQMLGNLAIVGQHLCDYATAQIRFEESLAIFREMGDRWGIAGSLGNLGGVALDQRDYSAALVLLEESLTICRELGDRRGIASSLNNLGLVAKSQRDYSAALVLLEESLTICREMGDRSGIADALGNLGLLSIDQSDYATAQALFAESLTLRRELGHWRGIVECLNGIACLKASLSAALLWGAAERLCQEISAPLAPSDRVLYENRVAAARAALSDDAAFDAAWAEGRALTVEQAITLALETAGS